MALVIVAIPVGAYFCYQPLIEKNRRYRQEILSLQAKIDAEERSSHEFRQSIESLQNDPRTVARRVRETRGYARTNETVIRFEPAIRR